MRIQRLRIDGFGHFAEREWGGFERPVTVFYGPNEAGKSTLLEFVRQVLFGYSRANSATYYPALAGGRYGGSVTIVSDGGETVIVQRTSGSHGGALTLTTAEGEPLPDSELQRLLGHSEDVFRKVSTFTLDELHNAALLSDSSVNSQIYSAGMGAANLPSALRSLSDDKGKLFRRGGSTQAVYHAAEKLKGIEERLREVANNAAEYGSLTARLAKAEAEIERLDGLRREHQSRYEQQQRLADAWDDWNALYEVERQLTELPPIGDFPVGGVSRLEALAEGARLARQYHDSTERDVKEARARAEAQIENEAISANAEAIRGIQRGRTFFDGAVHDLPERQSELTEYERSLQEALRYLGQDWDEPRLDTFDMSLVVQDEIRGYQQRLEGARSELRERESVLAQSEASLSEATDAKDKAEQEARAAVDTAGHKNGNVRLAIAGAAAGIVLFALGAILGGAALIVGAAAGIVLAGMAAYLFVFGRAATDTDAERVRLAREIDSSTALVERRKRRVEEIREDVEEARRVVEEAGGEWRQWLADRNLRPTFSPETVTDLRGRVELARTHLGNVRTWQERIRAIGKDISGYTEDVVPLAQQFGIPFDESDARTIAAAADRLIELDAAVAERVRERAEAQASLDRAERNLGERKEELSESERALVDLLQSGGAADAEDFRRRADAYTERVDLETKRNDIRGRLQRLSGPGDAFEAFMERLGETDLQAISDAIREATEDGDHCAADVERLSTVRGEAQAELRRLTSEEESSRLRMERNQLLEQIQGHAREWAVCAIAGNLLKEAQSKFERERQPDVIRHSQGFFGRITQERYQTVFSPLDRSEIHVTDSSGGTKQPNELSRGTREQLFLSLRFGYIRDLGGRAERLPVLVDEALVNFDPERGVNAAAAFTDLAQYNQVLVFTCHPQIVEWFQTAAARLGAAEPQVINI